MSKSSNLLQISKPTFPVLYRTYFSLYYIIHITSLLHITSLHIQWIPDRRISIWLRSKRVKMLQTGVLVTKLFNMLLNYSTKKICSLTRCLFYPYSLFPERSVPINYFPFLTILQNWIRDLQIKFRQCTIPIEPPFKTLPNDPTFMYICGRSWSITQQWTTLTNPVFHKMFTPFLKKQFQKQQAMITQTAKWFSKIQLHLSFNRHIQIFSQN